MRISVIIPMFNSRDTIINTLESILKQTLAEKIIEIIVVNDGSTDNSLEIVNRYRKKNIKIPIIIVNKKNGGVSSARNAGMKVAKGDWLALIDSDDEWLPNKIERQVQVIRENPEIDLLGGPFNNTELKIFLKKIDNLYKAKVSDICIKNFPQPSTVIFKKNIFDTIGGFDEKQRYAEDGNYFLEICDKYNLYYLPELLIIYDGGKRGFGERGLSGNLKEMYKGNKKNIKELREAKRINLPFFLFLRFYYWLKYIRRIIISSL